MYKRFLISDKRNTKLIFMKDKSKKDLIKIADHYFSLKNFSQSSNLNDKKSIGFRENFAKRHIGINEENEKVMLKTLKLNVNIILYLVN